MPRNIASSAGFAGDKYFVANSKAAPTSARVSPALALNLGGFDLASILFTKHGGKELWQSICDPSSVVVCFDLLVQLGTSDAFAVASDLLTL